MTYFIKFYFYKTYLVFFLIILRFRTIGKCFYDTPSCNAVENNGQMIAGLRQSHSPARQHFSPPFLFYCHHFTHKKVVAATNYHATFSCCQVL